MYDLSITQDYLLCTLNGKDKMTFYTTEICVCLAAGGIIELLACDTIEIQNKKIIVKSELSDSYTYLKPLYQTLIDKKVKNIDDLASTYSYTNKYNRALVASIAQELIKKDCVREALKKGIFKNKTVYTGDKDKVEQVIQKVRAELLEEGVLSKETAVLASLLEKSNLLKQYFSKYESKQLKARLKELKDTSEDKLIKQMVEYVQIMAVVASL